MRILLVFFSGAVEDPMAEFLCRKGYTIDKAACTSDAITLMDQHPDCILLDLVNSSVDLSPDKVLKNGVVFQYEGWRWVNEVLLPCYPEMRGRIIFYSADVAAFKRDNPDADTTQFPMISMWDREPENILQEIEKIQPLSAA